MKGKTVCSRLFINNTAHMYISKKHLNDLLEKMPDQLWLLLVLDLVRQSVLYLILDYCYRHRGESGIKALIIYPMNALASDQAKRIAELVDGSPELNSAGIRVGMYVDGQEKSSTKMVMPDRVITIMRLYWRLLQIFL